ncbi:5-formyltetrahydrofolate cyclo-ligase [Flavobacteriaceae bacterium]|nr:5-formyltetrahydrofolate cyclo-ligase [Flavobacteriaceae bacterium]MDB4767938.1 5-formyltetrahydrofolate cyclo-ligase [Flavobacteriaceae bacterium]
MNKKQLRTLYLKKRTEFSEKDIEEKSQAIANQLLQCPIWEVTYYSLFLPIRSKYEIDTEYILALLQGKDKEVCLPKMTSDIEMTHFLLTDNTLIKQNTWGVPEPQNGLPVPNSEIDVVFIPLLAYDKKGHRVGYGKGFYDRFLSKCRPETIKVGLSFFGPETLVESLDPTDIPLDFCVTPHQVHEFS